MKLKTRYRLHQALVFGLTFMSYALYHAGRQPFGTAKAALNPNTNSTVNNATHHLYDQSVNQPMYGMFNLSEHDQSINQSFVQSFNQSVYQPSFDSELRDPHSGFSPFNDPVHGSYWLSLLDTLFLAGYAAGMIVAGPLGDRLPLDRFLFSGMFGAGSLLILNGLFYYMNVHSVAAWGITNFCGGVFQATGWPSNVTVMTRWFSQATLGSILGIWSTQQPIGNVIGKYVGAGLQASYGWPFNFIGLGVLLCLGGLTMLFFLVNSPDKVFSADELAKIKSGADEEEKDALLEEQYQYHLPDDRRKMSDDEYTSINQSISQPINQPMTPPHLPISVHSALTAEHYEDIQLVNRPVDESLNQPIEHPHLSLWKCLMIPGVIEFGFALFFSKFLTYALMFWLPFYLTKSLEYSPDTASTLSTAFDYGGILGSVLAGVWSDWNRKRGWTSFLMSAACIPLLWMYEVFGSKGWFANVSLLFGVGIVVNGPYSLITSAVCSDLGRHPVLNGNPHAMSTVTGIIDGFGSVGATFNGVVVASVAASLGWTAVFYSLMIVAVLCCLSIVRVVKHELFGEKGVVYGQQSINESVNQSRQPGLKREVSVLMEDDDEDEEEQQIKILHKDVNLRN